MKNTLITLLIVASAALYTGVAHADFGYGGSGGCDPIFNPCEPTAGYIIDEPTVHTMAGVKTGLFVTFYNSIGYSHYEYYEVESTLRSVIDSTLQYVADTWVRWMPQN